MAAPTNADLERRITEQADTLRAVRDEARRDREALTATIERAVDRLEAGLTNAATIYVHIDMWTMARQQDAAQFQRLKEDIDGIKGIVQRIAWMIVGAVILAILGLVVNANGLPQ